MKTLADFKKRLKEGTRIHTVYHQAFAGRNDKNHYLLKDEDKGIRKVSNVFSNQFSLETINKDGKVYDSWLHFPKASEVKFLDDDTLQIYQMDFRRIEDGGTENMIPLVTYKFI